MANSEFTTSVNNCIQKASKKASRGNKKLDTSYTLVELMEYQDGGITPLLKGIGVDTEGLLAQAKNLQQAAPSKASPGSKKFSDGFLQAFTTAQEIAQKNNSTAIDMNTMLLAISQGQDPVSTLMNNMQATPKNIKMAISDSLSTGKKKSSKGHYPTLLEYGTDLTQRARDGLMDPVIGRETETRRVMEILSRRTKNNPVIVGPAGSGKTSVVEGLAQKIADNDCPEQLKGKTLVALDLTKLNAGASYKGDFENRIKDILEEIKSSEGEVITFIDEIHMITADNGSPMNLANMMKEYLARGVLKLIGATTLDEFRQYLEKDPALDRRFQKVYVDEPDTEDAIAILRGIKEKYEAHHGIMITDPALVSCVELSQRYIPNRSLPDKAIDLLDEACAKLRISISTAPSIIDELERKLANLETEKSAILDETTEVSRIRVQEINEELTEVREKLSQEKAKWENDQAEVEKVSSIRREIESEKRNEKKFSAEADWGASAQSRKHIEELQKELHEVEKEARSKGVSSRMVAQQVTPEIISEVVSSWTGVPASKMNASETERILSMGDRLRERVVGQDEAIEALVKAVKRSRSGVKDPNKPSSFMFAGSSGAGKSELSKALAEFLYDNEKALITFDMSEYADKTSVNKLVGASAGFIGFDSRPALEAVRDVGSAVLLFDEAEKADVSVLLTLLGAIEEGRLTLSNGKEVDFKNTIMIFTTNAGAPKDGVIDKEKAMEEVRHHEKFRPEFLNRLDDIIIFNPLDVESLKSIADIQVRKLERVIAHTRLKLDLTDSARDRIAYSGYDPAYGGRVVRRLVSNDIADLISDAIILGEVDPGSHVVIDTVEPFVPPVEELNDEQLLDYINSTDFPNFVLRVSGVTEAEEQVPEEELEEDILEDEGLIDDLNTAVHQSQIDEETDLESFLNDGDDDLESFLTEETQSYRNNNTGNNAKLGDNEDQGDLASDIDDFGFDDDNPYADDGVNLDDLFSDE